MSITSSKPVFKQRESEHENLSLNKNWSAVLQRIFSTRGISSSEETVYSLDQLLSPLKISYLSEAANLTAQHVINQSQILIFGDYDADGATSTALCVRALSLLGHRRVDFLLPDRLLDGYGLSENVAKRIVSMKPDLVITVDTGIASFKGIEVLRQSQIDVIVTDHHLPADNLPRANHVVNPNANKESAGKNLAGVGVAFYLMLALRSQLRDLGWFESTAEPNLAELLDLVAIGTVADLVPLDFNNRILVNEGLKRLRAGACSTGIQKLIELSRRNQKTLSSQDIGFSIAPRINAAGRLDDMSIGVQALMAQENEAATRLTVELDNINQYRRELQGQMTDQAVSMLEGLQHDLASVSERRGMVLFKDDWHEGVVGIIASKIKDLSYRPSICFARNESGELKGSGRSIPGIHLRDMLDLVDKQSPELIVRFGGHAMAAGLSIRQDKLQQFSEQFEAVLRKHVDANSFDNIVLHDGEIPAQELTMDLAKIIRDAGPWGQRFPVPTFVGDFRVVNQFVVADQHLKFMLIVDGMPAPVQAILFYAPDWQLKTNYQTIRIHYEMSVNEFRDEESLQLIIRHIA